MKIDSRTISKLGAGARRARRGGFSLVEVMVSVFILAIGLIMVITVFPVGGNWTRQATESSISAAVAQNALAIIQTRFPSTSVLPGALGTPFVNELNVGIPPEEMCYQYGATTPCPADPKKATYFWKALYRKSSNQLSGATAQYDIYILVFNKRSPDQKWSGSEIPAITSSVPYNTGTYDYATSTVSGAYPGVGEYGIGVESGTVFRQTLVVDNTPANPPTRPFSPTYGGGARPALKTGGEAIWTATPAAGNTVSPLVYVYQTTLSWKAPAAVANPEPP
jgi:prepilin-type N-terminal cleavage/methylation domain-containing protein